MLALQTLVVGIMGYWLSGEPSSGWMMRLP
jgi:hypothetical protein